MTRCPPRAAGAAVASWLLVYGEGEEALQLCLVARDLPTAPASRGDQGALQPQTPQREGPRYSDASACPDPAPQATAALGEPCGPGRLCAGGLACTRVGSTKLAGQCKAADLSSCSSSSDCSSYYVGSNYQRPFEGACSTLLASCLISAGGNGCAPGMGQAGTGCASGLCILAGNGSTCVIPEGGPCSHANDWCSPDLECAASSTCEALVRAVAASPRRAASKWAAEA